MSIGIEVTEVVPQYENIWINVSSIPDKPRGLMVKTDEKSCLVKPGDLVSFYGNKHIEWRSKGFFSNGVLLKLVGSKNHPRPALTAQEMLHKERQELLDQIKGLECELKTNSDNYEDFMTEIKKSHKQKLSSISSALANYRVYSMVVSVIAFVSTYLHFG